MTDPLSELYWDATYAIAIALIKNYPEVYPEDVGLHELANMIENLPGFVDDPALANEKILLEILTVWYEEATAL